MGPPSARVLWGRAPLGQAPLGRIPLANQEGWKEEGGQIQAAWCFQSRMPFHLALGRLPGVTHLRSRVSPVGFPVCQPECELSLQSGDSRYRTQYSATRLAHRQTRISEQAGSYAGRCQIQRQTSHWANEVAATDLDGRILHHHRESLELANLILANF